MYLTQLNYNLDYNWWTAKAEELKLQAKPYTDKRYGITVNDWLTLSFDHTPQSMKICNDFGVTAKSRIYWLMPGANIPEHVDNRTLCSLNFVLSNEPSPVIIEGKEYNYRQALLNTTAMHGVKNGNTERILLKFSIQDILYEDLAKRIPYKIC